MDHEVETQPAAVPAPAYEDLASLMEHVLLRPDLSETDVAQGVELAKRLGVAAVIVRPSDVDLAARWMAGSSVALGTVVDWPYGTETTSVKTYAVRDMLRRGVKEIDTVMNTGKLISRQFQYLEVELVQMADACHQSGAILKVILENQYLVEELKILACRICRRAGVDYIASAAREDMPLLKEYSKKRLKLKAWGGIDSLEQAQEFRGAGCERLQSEHSASILASWRAVVEKSPVVS